MYNNSQAPLYVLVRGGDPSVVYDTGSNKLIDVDFLTAKVLPLWGIYSNTEIISKLKNEHSIEEIKARLDLLANVEKEKGWFLRTRPDRFIPGWSKKEINDKLNSELDCLVLSVTTACNFRCSYCLYSGGYKGYRNHGTDLMSLKTAKKALDFFAVRSAKSEEIHLNFYGGEPLLNFDIIKWAVDKLPSVANGRNYYFHLTTNGYLLNNETIINFLIKNNFIIAVSLDGPQKYHDKRRRTKSGHPTFEVILEGLNLLKNTDPGYYRENVLFNSVINSADDLMGVRDYFINNALFKEHDIICSTVKKDSLEDNTNGKGNDKPLKDLENEFMNKLSSGSNNFDSFLKRIFIKELRHIYNTPFYDSVNKEEKLTNICIPGKKELFVTVDGLFHPCENTSDGLTLGSLEEGFDIDEIERICNDYADFCSSICKDCWAFRLCKLCYIHAFTDKKIDKNKMESYCKRERNSILVSLQRYHTVRKNYPQFIDSLGYN